MSKPSVCHTQLTDLKVARLSNISTGSSDFFARDSKLRGFGLRISPRNVKSFFVEATVSGRFIRRVIGRHPFMTVSEARREALEALKQIKYGRDSQSVSSAPRAILSLSTLSKEFLSRREGVLRPSTIADYRIDLPGFFGPIVT